ncbi:MAG: histidine kinase dimerization/phosphoacceptor domain -containing protein [Sulfitobacter sp.]|nr:histidine kinase dimerization/phosphoacceptor domain -containing protein [Sulfitobacter sp.]
MIDATAIEQEEMRLALLRGYGILDTAPERDFDEIAELAAEVCETPIALVSLVERERQWFKSAVGTDLTQTPIDQSICVHAMQTDEYLEIENTTKDPRTRDNPLVTGDDAIRFYAGAVLRDENGTAFGTLCVLDRRPRVLTPVQRNTIQVLARQVMRQIELRSALGVAEMLRKEVDHRVKNSLQSLEALIRIQARNTRSEPVTAALEAVQRRLAMVSKLHEALYLSDAGAAVNISSFLEKVLSPASTQMPPGIRIVSDIAPTNLESRSASSVGMIVVEAMTNTAKYAFPNGARGTFTVTGTIEGDEYVLTCSDDGAGHRASSEEGTGMGSRIMQAAAHQLEGTLETTESEKGYCIEVRWPLED